MVTQGFRQMSTGLKHTQLGPVVAFCLLTVEARPVVVWAEPVAEGPALPCPALPSSFPFSHLKTPGGWAGRLTFSYPGPVLLGGHAASQTGFIPPSMKGSVLENHHHPLPPAIVQEISVGLPGLATFWPEKDFNPLGTRRGRHCLLGDPSLIWTHMILFLKGG